MHVRISDDHSESRFGHIRSDFSGHLHTGILVNFCSRQKGENRMKNVRATQWITNIFRNAYSGHGQEFTATWVKCLPIDGIALYASSTRASDGSSDACDRCSLASRSIKPWRAQWKSICSNRSDLRSTGGLCFFVQCLCAMSFDVPCTVQDWFLRFRIINQLWSEMKEENRKEMAARNGTRFRRALHST